ncbi:AMP-binding protein [uncultured Schumannella sp.]|uniref:AMP-binding protein n=1 Tax=uncultured Schumannella sp. TaxID=1195956 RepID=UPI0025E5B6B5|nr:AMP-binding protein [uncultured Schumannella sp.]
MFTSPYADVVIPDQSIFDYLFGDLTESDLDRVAVVDGVSGAEMSYRELVAQIEAIAGALTARGLAPGDVVAVLCPNVPAFTSFFHAILRAGATVTTISSLYTPDEIVSQLADAHAGWLITVSPLLAGASDAAGRTGIDPQRLIVLDGADGHPSLRDLLAQGESAPDVHFDPATHVAVLPYSSGTTGKAKGVMLSHTNLVANVAQCRDLIAVTADDRVLALLPFFHIYGMTVLLNLALRQRARLVTMPRFELSEFLRIIQDHGCTYVFIAPPVAVALAKHPLVDEYDLSSVHTVLSGAAPLDGALGDAVAQRLGVRMLQGYGMSELSPVSHVVPRDRIDIPTHSVGVTIPNMQSKLIDAETGEQIEIPAEGVSRPGELLVRGPNVMLGYLGNKEATALTIDADRFLHTGDIATVSAEGFVTIVDRLKELIKYKGYQIAPAELEALLLSHPLVADAAVVGVRGDDGEEVPKAFVVAAGPGLTEDAVMTFVAEHLAPYKKVRRVEFVEAIPKSTSGKILRKDLRAREIA